MSEKQAIVVEMENGEVKNFGERGRLLSSHVITDTAIEVTFHIVSGEQVSYKHEVANLDSLTAEAAAFGFASKVKAATAGVAIEEIKSVIESKIAEFKAGIWATRGSAGESLSPLSQIQTAYAEVNEIDVTSNEGVAKVNAIFAAFSKEEKSALYADKAIKVTLARLKYEAALLLAK